MNKLEEFLQKLILQGIQLWPQDGTLRCAGPQHRITPEVLSQLKKHKPALLQRLCKPTYAPLSYGQRGLWFIHQHSPNNAAYNISLAYRIHSPLNVELLRDTIQLLVNRHASLRTRFIRKDDAWVQQINGYEAAAIKTIDASDWEPAYLLEQVRFFHERPFDLSAGPLFRAAIFKHAAQRYSLLLGAHHIIIDGWSVYQLIDELFTLYAALQRGMVAALPIIQHTYADYVAWEQALLQTDGARLWSYWQEQLRGTLPVLQLPTDYPRPPQQTVRGISQAIHLSTTLTKKLKQVAQQNGCTLYTVLLAAYQIFLHRYSGQEDILVGLPIAGRSHPEFSEIIGYFTSPVVARADISHSTFGKFLAQVKKTILTALDHQDYPFARLVEQLNPKRDPSRSPIFQASFVLQKPHRAQEFILQSNKREQFGLVIEPIPLILFEGQNDIALELMETSDGLFGHLKGNADLFTNTTLARMVGHIQVLLEGIVAESPLGVNQSIGELPLLTAAERHQILVEWNDTATDYPKDKCIHHLFEQQVKRTPDAVAVVFDGDVGAIPCGCPLSNDADQQKMIMQPATLTYRELNERANQLAHYLITQGVGPEILVGICVERSPTMVVGLLGILKAGGAYVPLDPSYPEERLAFMLQDSNVSVLLTLEHLRESLPPTAAQVVCLDFDWSMIAKQNSNNLSSQVKSDNLAYLIYTSGSTGTPKGVLITHHGLCNVTNAHINTYKIQPTSRHLQVVSLNFDVATADIFMTLCAGATLHLTQAQEIIIGDILLQQLRRRAITHLQVPVSILSSIPYEELPMLQTIIVGGEEVSLDLVKQWSASCDFFNAYGATEATICTTIMACNEGAASPPRLGGKKGGPGIKGGRPPIGSPIDNVQVYILDQKLQPVPVGVPGELHIGGAGLARGYRNRPQLTAEKFILNPFDPTKKPGRLYKTGDLARWLSDGNIEFLGRLDHQVKLRGFRIELGEIEATLTHHPAIREAVVLAREEQPGNKQLVGYLAGPAQETEHVGRVRSWLQEKLPDYMIPSAFVLLDALPLTPNGKVDRKALPAPDMSTMSRKETFVPPRTPTEMALANIWSQVLGLERIGIHDNFFELGGHSLLATQVVSRIRDALSIDISLRDFFVNSTVLHLSEHIETHLLIKSLKGTTLSANKELEEI